MRARRRRRDGQLPPARRLGALRRPGPHGAALVAALPDDRPAGQLRLARQRPGRGDTATPSAGCSRWPWRCCATSTRRPSTSSRTTRATPVEPVILPARIPNLLVNGSEGIAVGMATRIPPHNLREVAAGVTWALDHPDATDEELLEELIKAVPGPDFPTRGADRRPRRHRGRLPHRPRLDPDARRRHRRGGRQGPHDPGRHRTALPGEPRQPRRVDRHPGQGGQGRRHRRHQRRVLRPHRHAHRRHDQARRRRQGGAEQPVQAHPAADDVRREHAGDRRRRAAHPAPGPVRQPLRRPPDRGHRPADAVPAAQGRGARPHPARPAQGARPARRGHRPDPAFTVGRRGPGRADGAARDRRGPGRRHPRPAAAPAGRPGAAADHGRSRRDRGAHRRPQRHPGQAGQAAADHPGRTDRDRRTGSATSGARVWCPTTATCRWKT